MRHNGRAPLLASAMRPEHLNLREGEPRTITCPDCSSWRRLERSMITPHRLPGTAPAGDRPRRYFGDKPSGGQRCPGSAQRVTFDISVEEWSERLLAADSTAMGRRSAQQHSKPIPAPAPAVAQMSSTPLRAVDAALAAYRAHRTACRTRCTDKHACPEAWRLATRYERLLRTQPRRDEVRRELDEVQQRMCRRAAGAAARTRVNEWQRHGEATTDASATAKRSGASVEELNNTNRRHPAGVVSAFRGPDVPLEHLRVDA
ncbi:hypothetical protein [Streptomyces genisteinicus]|uniref:Uncharacterized protein n=1 Tax=Streptomyces genisteinicus TaxID=2768068 RepID=A0A7H0I594_9ACTN|nr:hypothetical protein [Streptomyces genisteinicus]QNP67960.1 hypothetical protein IAG43_33895 [Streptomyces genisteinicus]